MTTTPQRLLTPDRLNALEQKPVLHRAGSFSSTDRDYLVADVRALAAALAEAERAREEAQRALCEAQAIIDATTLAMSTPEDVNDFMLSFPLVRAAADCRDTIVRLSEEITRLRQQLISHGIGPSEEPRP